MMKNNFVSTINTLMIFICTVLLLSCDSEYEPIFNESPDERVGAELNRYEELLMSAPHGWKAALYTGSGAGYFFYFDFHEDGSVSMLSDFNSTTAGDVMESTWTLKALQQITLSFTTYSYIHLPADPDGNINNGIPGSGLLSDFEFSFANTSGDSVVMKGLQHNTQFVLVRSTEEEKQAYLDKRIQYLLQQTETFLTDYKSYILSLPGGLTVPMALSLPRKMISFQYVDGDSIQIPVTSYTFSIDGILLKDPITIGTSMIDKLLWDDDAGVFYVPLTERVDLAGSNEPFILTPPTSLSEVVGHQLVTAVIPGDATQSPLPGQSEQFTGLLSQAADQMLNGDYRLTLEGIRFVFVPNTDRMLMVVSISQPAAGGGSAWFEAQYTYSYQVREGGLLKFKLELTNNNANIIYPDLAEILSHFDNDTFKMEYVGGGFGLIASFFSREDVEYYFAGYLL
jgi:hypothetical protein